MQISRWPIVWPTHPQIACCVCATLAETIQPSDADNEKSHATPKAHTAKRPGCGQSNVAFSSSCSLPPRFHPHQDPPPTSSLPPLRQSDNQPLGPAPHRNLALTPTYTAVRPGLCSFRRRRRSSDNGSHYHTPTSRRHPPIAYEGTW